MSAVFSPCGGYRYRLDRNVSLFGTIVLGFLLHNSSRADALIDDPTLDRCMAFGATLGAARIVLVNPWAGCATDPADLWRMDDPVGPDNDAYIADAADEVAASGGYMIVGWGRHGAPRGREGEAIDRLRAVAVLVDEQTCPMRALGVNGDGSPKHPLYVASHVRPLPWSPPPVAGARRGSHHLREGAAA